MTRVGERPKSRKQINRVGNRGLFGPIRRAGPGSLLILWFVWYRQCCAVYRRVCRGEMLLQDDRRYIYMQTTPPRKASFCQTTEAYARIQFGLRYFLLRHRCGLLALVHLTFLQYASFLSTPSACTAPLCGPLENASGLSDQRYSSSAFSVNAGYRRHFFFLTNQTRGTISQAHRANLSYTYPDRADLFALWMYYVDDLVTAVAT